METTNTVDTSPFSDWLENTTHRAEYKGCGIWGIYERCGDAYVFIAHSPGPANASLSYLLQQVFGDDEWWGM